MRTVRRALSLLLSLLLLGVPINAQQSHVVDAGAVDQALAQRVEDTLVKRETIRTALQHGEVRVVAERLGLDLVRAEAAVNTLDGAALEQIASQAQLVNDTLAGGQTVRLNLLWIIIGLLVIILIIVAD